MVRYRVVQLASQLFTFTKLGSVIHGIATTARVITSAALIMIAVFLGFVLGEDPIKKMFGLGLATAIFVDVAIVRMILVPASMTLMGDRNWWIPAWLDRLLPTIDIDGDDGFEGTELGSDAPSDDDHVGASV